MEENNQTTNSTKMNPMLIGGIIVVILVIGAVAVFATGSLNPSSPSSNDAMKTENTEDTVSMANESMNENEAMAGEEAMEGEAMDSEEAEDAMAMQGTIEVEGGAFYFDPNEIRVKAGEEVTIVLNSVDMQHDFVIDELDVRTDVTPGGESDSVTFTPTGAGEYEFYCSVGNHRAQGMVGTLIVEE